MRRQTLAHMMSSIVDELDNMQHSENSAAASTTTHTIAATCIATRDPTIVARRPVSQLLHGQFSSVSPPTLCCNFIPYSESPLLA